MARSSGSVEVLSGQSVDTVVQISDESGEVEVQEVLNERPLAAVRPGQPFPVTQREMELAELEVAKINFEKWMRLMDEDPAFREDEEEGIAPDKCYQAVEESRSSNREGVMEEEEEYYPYSPEPVRKDDVGIDPWQYLWYMEEPLSSDPFEFSDSGEKDGYGEESLPQEEPEETEAQSRARKGKAPMIEEEPEPKPKKKEISLGTYRNPLLYFSHKKGPTQRAWEGKVPPWRRQEAKDELKAAAVEEDDEEVEESEGSDA